MYHSLKLMDCSWPGFSVHEILQARILEWVAVPLLVIFPVQGLNPCPFCPLHWQVGSSPLVLPGKPKSTNCPKTGDCKWRAKMDWRESSSNQSNVALPGDLIGISELSPPVPPLMCIHSFKSVSNSLRSAVPDASALTCCSRKGSYSRRNYGLEFWIILSCLAGKFEQPYTSFSLFN